MLMGGYFGRYVSATQQRNKIGILYTRWHFHYLQTKCYAKIDRLRERDPFVMLAHFLKSDISALVTQITTEIFHLIFICSIATVQHWTDYQDRRCLSVCVRLSVIAHVLAILNGIWWNFAQSFWVGKRRSSSLGVKRR